MAEVRIKRTELNSPTLEDADRKVYQIEYRSGELPPRFLFIPKADWTADKEKEMIREDLKARAEAKEETLEI
jgi:hypothetical protein